MTKETISIETKQQIADDLRKYVEVSSGGSANRASKMLSGISNAYISNMLNGKWDMISDEAWRNVQKQVSNIAGTAWVTVETRSSRMIGHLFSDAKNHALTFGVIGDAGTGKTHTCKHWEHEENTFIVSCSEFMNRKTFLAELLRKMGKDSGGYTVGEMMSQVISQVRKVEQPLIVLDEADKLTDQVFYFFITLYNHLEGKCGIILLATDYLEKRVERGLRLNKKGYKEIYSRLGRKFLEVPRPSVGDQKAVITANGISDPTTITAIINDADNDLRRVERLVHANRRKGVQHG
ncbi:MAG: AAA family ATPase [Mongoliitalea sp.]